MKFITVLFLVASTLFLVNCDSGGSTRIAGPYCSFNKDIVSPTDGDKQKLSKTFKKGEDETIPDFVTPGNYTLTDSQLYVKNSDQSIRIQINTSFKDKKNNDELDYSVNIGCVGGNGLSSDMEPMTFEATVPYSFKTEEGSDKVNVKYHTVKFDLRPRPKGQKWLQMEIIEDIEIRESQVNLSSIFKTNGKNSIEDTTTTIYEKNKDTKFIQLRTHVNLSSLGTNISEKTVKSSIQTIQYSGSFQESEEFIKERAKLKL